MSVKQETTKKAKPLTWNKGKQEKKKKKTNQTHLILQRNMISETTKFLCTSINDSTEEYSHIFHNTNTNSKIT
jgi:hypothetical protein